MPSRAACSTPPVHPRASGEREIAAALGRSEAGSSPRERGTRRAPPPSPPRGWFIPARAGNARSSCARLWRSSVHPRASGERLPPPEVIEPLDGSSPRERGTRRRASRHASAGRFIPARAGNAMGRMMSPVNASVHPRASGERAWRSTLHQPCTGSSPRERGTPRGRGARDRLLRFIPARAGNARRASPPGFCGPVHPRASGERWITSATSAFSRGSSPRERGTRQHLLPRRLAVRFIPARAGNARCGPLT